MKKLRIIDLNLRSCFYIVGCITGSVFEHSLSEQEAEKQRLLFSLFIHLEMNRFNQNMVPYSKLIQRKFSPAKLQLLP